MHKLVVFLAFSLATAAGWSQNSIAQQARIQKVITDRPYPHPGFATPQMLKTNCASNTIPASTSNFAQSLALFLEDHENSNQQVPEQFRKRGQREFNFLHQMIKSKTQSLFRNYCQFSKLSKPLGIDKFYGTVNWETDTACDPSSVSSDASAIEYSLLNSLGSQGGVENANYSARDYQACQRQIGRALNLQNRAEDRARLSTHFIPPQGVELEILGEAQGTRCNGLRKITFSPAQSCYLRKKGILKKETHPNGQIEIKMIGVLGQREREVPLQPGPVPSTTHGDNIRNVLDTFISQ